MDMRNSILLNIMSLWVREECTRSSKDFVQSRLEVSSCERCNCTGELSKVCVRI